MTQLERQMIDELAEAKNFVYDLAENLITQGVSANNTEGLDTLVPKVLEIDSGVAKSPYDEWQEGFNANWDSVIQNAPQTGVNPVLHIYSKVKSIRYLSTFPTTATIVTYNPTTGIYRPVVVDANKNLFFEESDYFINDSDGMYYTCVIYKASGSWSNVFSTTLPVVYSNSKSANDQVVNLINLGGYTSPTNYPFLRGLDINNLSGLVNNSFSIGESLEHLTVQSYDSIIGLARFSGKDTQVRILKDIVDNAPSVTSLSMNNVTASISDEKLANWLYNDFFYNRFSGNSYRDGLPPTNIVRQFNIKTDVQFSGNQYLRYMPNMIYIEGFISEDPTNTTSAGLHNGLRTNAYTLLQNFPMWKVLEGASTGCLLPMNEQTNIAIYLQGSFDFYSTNLEPKYFCEFDENGIIEDPAKYFICNLPFETISHTNIQVRFRDLTFKNNYTSEQQNAISAYLTNKNWNLVW